MLARKFFLLASYFAITPIALLLALILFLVRHHQYYHGNYANFELTKTFAFAAQPTLQNVFAADISEQDGRAEKIRQFLARYNSPLEPYASLIVETADKYNLDYRLIPAIAMQESNLCRVIPVDSYNCWGFGIYAKKVTRFSGFEEAIETVTKTLSLKYKNKGLETPEEIMTMWTPSSNGSWAFSVNHFMDILK